MLINTKVAKKIGLLHPLFFLYFEETEWCLRAKKNNFATIVNTKALAFHTSSTKNNNYHYYMTRNRILLAKLEKNYYKLTRTIILKNLLKEFVNKLTFRNNVAPFWFSRFKGFLSGVFNPIKE